MHCFMDASFCRDLKKIYILLSGLIGFGANAHAELVGTLAGSLSVDQGVATYSIPIEVPPGTAGMAPEISLNYSSQSGNGIAGVGWSLGGLSVIHRCPQTLAQDNRIDGISFDLNDRFCIDGQRLISVRGADGGDGTEYRTEVDGYSRIVSYGQAGSGPAWWEVKTKSGLTMRYGSTDNSRIEAQGRSDVSIWVLSRTTDTKQNYIAYNYTEENSRGHFRLNRIEYTGNDAAGLTPYSSVRFVYENRPDATSGYAAGSKVSSPVRLTHIRIYNGSDMGHEYRLNYLPESVTNRSQVASIQLCGQEECMPETSFEYSSLETGFWENDARWSVSADWGGAGYTWTGDFNGDGFADIASAKGGTVYMKLSTGGGFVSESWPVQNIWGGAGYTKVGDFNGDGLMDIASSRGSVVYMKLSTGSGFVSEYWLAHNSWGGSGYTWVADFNGDGLADIASAKGGTVYMKLSTGKGFVSESWPVQGSWGGAEYTRVADFNGDGLADIASAKGGTVYMKLSTGKGFVSESWPVQSAWGGSGYTWIADFNGDGLADIASAKGGTVYMKISTGSGFVSESWPVKNIWGGAGYTKVADFDGDGLPDVASAKGGFLYMKLSTGKGFRSEMWAAQNTWGGAGYTWAADFNGDGLADIASAKGGSVYMRMLSSAQIPGKLVRLVNGMGLDSSISYSPLTNYEIYLKGSKGRYPVMDIQKPMYVVSKVDSDDGVGDRATTSYRYGESRVHLKGRGALGFRWVETTDEATGRVSYVEKIQDVNHPNFPFNESVTLAKESIRDSSGSETVLSTSESRVEYVSHYAGIYAPRLVKSIDITNDVNGDPLTTVTTQNSEYDFYGNAGRIVVTTEGAGKRFTKTTLNTYSNFPGKWHLGRLTRAVVIHDDWDGEQETRTSRFNYDYATGLLTAEFIEPDTPQYQRTVYTYDRFGNKESATVSGYGVTARTTRTFYDENGRYPVKTVNALGHSETRQYDPLCGAVSSLTGPNGLTTRWRYDASCRKIEETRADGTWTRWNYIWADRWKSGVDHSVYAITKESSGQSGVTTFYDKLGRELRKVSRGFDGRTVYQDTQYDALGRVARASVPYFYGETSYWVESEYDRFGRLIETRKPDTFGGWLRSHVEYDRFWTTEINAKGQRKRTLKNAIGQTERVEEEEGAWISYEYDATGNLTQTNANGVVTTIEYDNRGNKIAMNDPDMGIWVYRHNAFGELVWQKDAKQQVTSMRYDQLGRMVQRTEAQGTTTWIYDSAANGVGKLAEVRAPGGFRQQFRYDNLGRPVETWTYADSQKFSVKTQYDGYSRVSAVIRPQNFRVENVYNRFGYLAAVRSPRGHIRDYDYAHLARLLEATTKAASELISKALQYESLARGYRSSASTYRHYADIYSSRGRSYRAEAGRLRKAAADLDALAVKLESEAKAHRQQAERYSEESRKLEAIGASLAMSPWTRAHGLAALAQANKLKVKAQTELDSAKTKLEQAAANRAQADANEKSAAGKAYLSQVNLDRARRHAELARAFLTKANEAYAKAKAYRAEGSELQADATHYSAMLKDTRYVYFWRAKSFDASGRLTGEIAGNGLVTNYGYDQATGRLRSIGSGFGYAGNSIRSLEFQYDELDNVTSRQDHILGLQESFYYDSLNRLTQSTITGQLKGIAYNRNTTYDYDTQGNITYNSDVGRYTYGDQRSNTPGPHAVINAGSQHRNYRYDANGNLLAGGGRSITWTSFNKPARFEKGGKVTTFAYGPDRARYLKTTNTSRTLYIGKVYEKVIERTGAKTRIADKHFIYANGQLIAIHIKRLERKSPQADDNPLPDETRYLHRDNLGSIDTITDGRGNVVERMSYEAFGKRRGGDWRAATDTSYTLPSFTNRGYTGHEHVDEMGLIHMNGRVYDPELGRFLSADPNVQAAENSQSYNRYSYVLNNPLKYTDPSGYFWKKLKKFIKKNWRVIAAIGLAVVTGGATLAYLGTLGVTGFWAAVGAGAASGFVSGGVMTWTLRGALTGAAIGAVSAGAAWGIGHAGGAMMNSARNFAGGLGRNIMHGIAQGGISSAQGGTFRAGFWSGSLGSAVPVGQDTSFTAKAIAGAVVGGTASRLGGGKFANGAMSGAFVQMFNHGMESYFVKAKVNKLLQVGYDSNKRFAADFTPVDGYKVSLTDGRVTVKQGGQSWSFDGTDVSSGGISLFGKRLMSMSLTVSPAEGGGMTFTGSVTYNPTVFGLTAGGSVTVDVQDVMLNSSGMLGITSRAIRNRYDQIECITNGAC